VALACQAAAEAVRTVRDDQAVSVVWTGPSSPLVPVRSTAAVLCELIDAACDELLVVSFAAYRVEAVVAALGRAALLAPGPTARAGPLKGQAPSETYVSWLEKVRRTAMLPAMAHMPAT